LAQASGSVAQNQSIPGLEDGGSHFVQVPDEARRVELGDEAVKRLVVDIVGVPSYGRCLS